MAARHFLARLWHVFFPNKKFYMDQKFRRVTYMLSLVRLSYPKWRDALQAARQRDLPPGDKAHLANLFALVEYFIPLVSYYHQIWFVRCLIVTICSKNLFRACRNKSAEFSSRNSCVCRYMTLGYAAKRHLINQSSKVCCVWLKYSS